MRLSTILNEYESHYVCTIFCTALCCRVTVLHVKYHQYHVMHADFNNNNNKKYTNICMMPVNPISFLRLGFDFICYCCGVCVCVDVDFYSISHGYLVFLCIQRFESIVVLIDQRAIHSAECWSFSFICLLSLVLILFDNDFEYTLIIMCYVRAIPERFCSNRPRDCIRTNTTTEKCFLITSKIDAITNVLFPPSIIILSLYDYFPSRLCIFMICARTQKSIYAYTWSSSD